MGEEILKMDNDFQEIINEQVRDSAIYEVVEDVLLEYSLKKTPASDSLQACLEVYTKKDLLRLANQNGIDVKVSWNKEPIIDSLHDGIMNTIIERFLILGDKKTKLLYQFSIGEFDTKEATLEKLDFFLTVYPLAVHMGFIYSLNTENDVQMVIPFEVKEALAYFMNQRKEIQKQYQTKISIMKQIEESLLAAVHLYGVVTLNRIRDLWEIQYAKAECIKEFKVLFPIVVPLIAIKHEHDYFNNRFVSNYRLIESEYAKDFYYHVLEKMANDYYIPSKKEIRYYAQYPFNQHSPTYKKMRQLVSKITPDIDMVLQFIESSIQLGESLADLILEIQRLGFINFESDKQLYEFAELHTQLHNNSRLWENAGYTPSELASHLTDGPLTSYQRTTNKNNQSQHTKKVGRNNPCPCGSGKKYKKCCWNK